MQLYKPLVFFGLMGFLEAEIVNVKRDVKHIENTYLADLPQTDVDATLSRSFLECINMCHVISNCLSTFYKDNVCWLVKGTVSCSTPSCFQVKNETTKAYVELYANSLEIQQPTTEPCHIQISPPDPCMANMTKYCGSMDMGYNSCVVLEASSVNSLTVQHQQSQATCDYGTSFGIMPLGSENSNSFWVDNGCRADFLVCYTPVT